MEKEQIQKLIDDALNKKIADFNSFKQWRSFDSVSDVYSPITGASPQIGFYGASKISKPTITGAKAGNAALTSVCSVLAALGLATNSTT